MNPNFYTVRSAADAVGERGRRHARCADGDFVDAPRLLRQWPIQLMQVPRQSW